MPELSITAPEGAHFAFDEVKTKRGTESLGNVPILIWDDVAAATNHYGAEGIASILDGTSCRVAFQAIARRMKAAGKSDDEIAAAQVAYRPGKRAVGASTPISRARNAAAGAATQLGDKADLLTQVMEKIQRGEVTAEDLELFVK